MFHINISIERTGIIRAEVLQRLKTDQRAAEIIRIFAGTTASLLHFDNLMLSFYVTFMSDIA